MGLDNHGSRNKENYTGSQSNEVQSRLWLHSNNPPGRPDSYDRPFLDSTGPRFLQRDRCGLLCRFLPQNTSEPTCAIHATPSESPYRQTPTRFATTHVLSYFSKNGGWDVMMHALTLVEVPFSATCCEARCYRNYPSMTHSGLEPPSSIQR